MVISARSTAGAVRILLLGAPLLLGRALASGPAEAVRCEPAGTVRVAVAFAPPAGKTIAGVKIALDYPERSVALPGFGGTSEVTARVTDMPSGFLGAPNDLDDVLIVALAGTSGLPTGQIFTVTFDRCAGTPQPAPKDFTCKVEQASTDTGVLVDGAKCSAAIASDARTHPNKKAKNTKKTEEESR